MKCIVALCLLLASCLTVGAQQNNAEQVAGNIAQKMKDSLNLSLQQKDQIFSVNMQLSDQKGLVRQQYTSDSLRIKIQLVENSRDSLYRAVLTEQQYELYRQKKRNLVNNN